MTKYPVITLLAITLTACEKNNKNITTSPIPGIGIATNTEPIEILVFGQSNAVSPANGFPLRYSVSGHVKVTDYYCDGNDPYKRYPDTTCINGNTLVTPTEQHPIQSNQTWLIVGDSLYGQNGRDITFYNRALSGHSTSELIDEGLAPVLITLQDHPEIQLIIWNQGESESSISPENSYENLKYIIEETRKISPNLRWLVALNSYGRTAQQKLIDEHIVLPGPDIDKARAQFNATGDPAIEFQGPGHDIHAQAWLDVLKQMSWNE